MKIDQVTDKPLTADRRRLILGFPVLAAGIAWPVGAIAAESSPTTLGAASPAPVTHYRTKAVDGIKISSIARQGPKPLPSCYCYMAFQRRRTCSAT